MFKYYIMTPLEEYIENLYLRFNIKEVNDLTIDILAQRLNIWLHYFPMKSIGIELHPGQYSMVIDKRLTPNEQWLDFLHELCHLLLHAGNQMLMPISLIESQEKQAELFVLYASIPFSFINRMEKEILPSQSASAQLVSEVFHVNVQIANKRLEQIKRRCFEGALHKKWAKLLQESSSNNERILIEYNDEILKD